MSDSELSIQRKLDEICDQFEEQWSADGEINFVEYLEQIDRAYGIRLLRMLIEVDIELRKKNDLPVSSDNYSEVSEDAVVIAEELLDVDNAVTVPPSNSNRSNLDSTETIPPPENNLIGSQIGPYKLLQQIGEGGMGSVYMAEQERPVRRRVALKLIRGDMGSKETIARFEAERQALAMMDHQNIAKVLDAGTTETGNPFFVMELVKGIPITQYCDENKLSIKQRLGLFVPVCNAIQHAHQKGIIHRDLKPSNVLVTLYDGKPIPKVIDFGLAKALEHTTKLTDKTMFTEFGKVVGTVQYMAPEQAEMNALDVDTRTDVYSLGVMLYQLLTGSTPLDKETLNKNALLQLLAIIREKEPPRPSTRLSESGDAVVGISEQRKIAPARLHQILRGELDWIVMKAIEKDRTRRYETANGFANDINHYLNHQPVLARPPSAWYRISKFVNRNRLETGMAVAFILVIIAGFVGTISFAFKASKSEKKATQNANKSAQSAAIAKQRLGLAMDSLQAITNIIDDDEFLKSRKGREIRDKLAEVSVGLANRLEQEGDLDPETDFLIRLAIFYRQIPDLEKVSNREASNEDLKASQNLLQELFDFAAAHPRNEIIQSNLAEAALRYLRLQSSEADLKRVVELCQSWQMRKPSDETWARLLIESLEILAAIQASKERVADSLNSLKKAEALCDSFGDSIADKKMDIKYLKCVFLAQHNQFEEALSVANESIKWIRSRNQGSDRLNHYLALPKAYSNRAGIRIEKARFERAIDEQIINDARNDMETAIQLTEEANYIFPDSVQVSELQVTNTSLARNLFTVELITSRLTEKRIQFEQIQMRHLVNLAILDRSNRNLRARVYNQALNLSRLILRHGSANAGPSESVLTQVQHAQMPVSKLLEFFPGQLEYSFLFIRTLIDSSRKLARNGQTEYSAELMENAKHEISQLKKSLKKGIDFELAGFTEINNGKHIEFLENKLDEASQYLKEQQAND